MKTRFQAESSAFQDSSRPLPCFPSINCFGSRRGPVHAVCMLLELCACDRLCLGSSRQVKSSSHSFSAQPRRAAFTNHLPFHHLILTLYSPRSTQSVSLLRTISLSNIMIWIYPLVHSRCTLEGCHCRKQSVSLPSGRLSAF